MEEIIVAKGINKKIQWTSDFLWDFFYDVNFTIYKGEFVVIAGNSGSGKSTLLGILLGYDKEAEGTVLINNVNISEINQIQLEKFRSENIGLCYEYKAPINLDYTVKENIYRRLQCFENRDIEQEAEEILRIFNLTSIADQTVLLGTTKDYYRIMLALAFCGMPPIVIIDETLDYLPEKERKGLLETIMSLQKSIKLLWLW